jgi:hypothetical protein
MLILMIQYRGGIRDAGVYLLSGDSILNKDNPYLPADGNMSRWGTFGPVPFSALLSILPEIFQVLLLQLMNFLSVGIIIKTFKPKIGTKEFLVVYILSIWSSPFREGLATNQMSCITLGLVALTVSVIQKRPRTIISWLLAAIPMAMALDLKPHLTFVFFISLCIYLRSWTFLLFTSFILLITHGVINLYHGRILEVDWLNSIISLNSSAKKNNLGDSVAFWPLVNEILDKPTIIYFMSIFIFLLATVYSFISAKNLDGTSLTFLSFAAPSLFIYFHFYDMVLLTIITIITLIRFKEIFLSVCTLSMILVPKIWLEPKNWTLVILLSFLLVIWKFRLENIKKLHIYKFCLGIIMSVAIHMFNDALELDQFLLQTLIVSECLLLCGIVYLKSRFINNKLSFI